MTFFRDALRAYGRRQWAALAEPDVAAVVFILYALANLATRLLLSPNLMNGAAAEMLFGKSLQTDYGTGNFPLMHWLAYVVLVSGAGRTALFTVKYLLLAASLLFYFAAARAVLHDVRCALLCVLGLLSTLAVGFLTHADIMQPVLMGALLALQLWLGLGVLAHASLMRYALLGLCIGLGLLSHPAFTAGIFGLVLALLGVRAARARLRWDGFVVALGIAALVAGPFASSLLGKVPLPARPPASLPGALQALFVLFVPFVPFFAVFFWRGFGRVRADGEDAMHLNLLEIAMTGALVAALAAALFGAPLDTVALFPAFLPLPIYLFQRARLAGRSERAERWFAAVAFLCLLLAGGARFALYDLRETDCGRCAAYLPYARFGTAVHVAGFFGGTILAADAETGGNLQALFRDARVMTPGYPPGAFGATGALRGQCLIAWLGTGPMPQALSDYAHDRLSVTSERGADRGEVRARYLGSHAGLAALSYELLPSGSGQCH